jgi:hypothetical protein
MTRKYRWRVVLANGHRTAVWSGMAASKAEAEARALADHPGWFVQESDRAAHHYS